MDVVGTSALTVVDGRAVPRGRRHAIGPDGAPRCRAGVAYRFPALPWAGGDDAERCEPCAAALAGPSPGADAYPDEPPAAVRVAPADGTGTSSYAPAVIEERSVVAARGC